MDPNAFAHLSVTEEALSGSMSSHPENAASGSLPSLLVLYGSQTGNGQDVAERIGREARRRYFKARVMDMDTYDIASLIEEPLVIFVCSTTGQGVEPRNMTKLWKALLRSDLPEDMFDGMDFAVFGLGDSSYLRFNWAAKKLQRRLESLGAREIWERGEADDQHYLGVDGALDPWIGGLFSLLLAMYPLPAGVDVSPQDELSPPRVKLQFLDSKYKFDSSTSPSFPGASMARVACNRRITSQSWYQDVRHLEFEFEHDISYNPGDIAILHPENDPAEVEQFLLRMGWLEDADRPFRIILVDDDRPLPDHWPEVTTLRAVFTRYLDILGVPRRSFFEHLAYFTAEPMETEKLRDFCSPEGQDDLYAYCHRVRRTATEVISDFRSARIPREYIFDVFPEIRPREFSIASSVKAHPRQIHLCAAIVQYKTKLKTPRKGVCTSWLARLRPGDDVQVGIESGTMHLPPRQSTPVIFVGPGTGVAPMRSFIEQRAHDGATDNALYFGCRSLQADCHYADEWREYEKKGELIYRVAPSRDQLKKVYVQHLLLEDAERLWKTVHESKGYVYISGSSNKMPLAVREAIQAALQEEGNMSEAEATDYVKRMEMTGRLQEECWS